MRALLRLSLSTQGTRFLRTDLIPETSANAEELAEKSEAKVSKLRLSPAPEASGVRALVPALTELAANPVTKLLTLMATCSSLTEHSPAATSAGPTLVPALTELAANPVTELLTCVAICSSSTEHSPATTSIRSVLPPMQEAICPSLSNCTDVKEIMLPLASDMQLLVPVLPTAAGNKVTEPLMQEPKFPSLFACADNEENMSSTTSASQPLVPVLPAITGSKGSKL